MDSQQTAPPIPPNFLDMNELLAYLFKKIEQLEQDVRQSHSSHLEETQMQNGALVRTLERNTRVLEKIEKLLNKRA